MKLHSLSYQRGVSLIEVLITMVVVAFGLLGLAAFQAKAQVGSIESYQRAQAAVLLGSPAKEGPFVIRLKLPDGFAVPAHRHSKDEFLTVISGRFGVAAGGKLDKEGAVPLPAASFIHLPAGMPHAAWASG